MPASYGMVVRGGLDGWTVVLTDSAGWAVGSNLWTWKMLIGTRQARTTLALAITSTTSIISTVTAANDTMTLTFDLTGADSQTLAGGSYYVEIEADNAGDEYYYSCVHGELSVREPEAGG